MEEGEFPMITLDVAEYCHNCAGFEPKAEETTMVSGDEKHVYTVVRCVNNRKCFNIQRYLAKEMEKRYDGRTVDRDSE